MDVIRRNRVMAAGAGLKLSQMLNTLGLAHLRTEAGNLHDALPDEGFPDWRRLSVAASLWCRENNVRVLGISGGQGAGKSTLARYLAATQRRLGRVAVNLSLDDFYLKKSERERLAKDVHPLLVTRGVPGTHDVALADATLSCLLEEGDCEIPRFDKAVDDRRANGDLVHGPVDLVIFEGWCVGASAQPADELRGDCNLLETREDPDGIWRRYVNERLAGDYAGLWAKLDSLIYLRVPDLQAVFRWRGQQEQAHEPTARMDTAELERFIAHYERLTAWMVRTLTSDADIVCYLDKNHDLVDLSGP